MLTVSIYRGESDLAPVDYGRWCDPPTSVLLQAHEPPDGPGAWALRHVEAPANVLSCKCKRLAPLRRLLRERLPDDDDLDRLATSAGIEVGL
jgi:hypothetical protein